MSQTEVLLELANERLQGAMRAADLERERKEVSAGFRVDDKVFVAKVTWKKVKYSGKESYHFTLEVFSLDPQRKEKRPVARVSDGKVRPISQPVLNLELTRNFKQEIQA